MRNVISLAHVSFDGFMATPDGDLSWVKLDQEAVDNIHPLIHPITTAIYGRTTYEMMLGYWPTVLAEPAKHKAHERDHAAWVDKVEKVVFSRTLGPQSWTNTRVVAGNLAEEIAALKRRPGADIMIFGSPSITRALLALDLIDEWYVTINPVILGHGIPMFGRTERPVQLELRSAKTFASGAVFTHHVTRR